MVFTDQPEETGAYHLLPDVPSRALTCSGAKFNMVYYTRPAQWGFEVENELLDEEDDMMVFSAVGCFMRRDLNRTQGYFE